MTGSVLVGRAASRRLSRLRRPDRHRRAPSGTRPASRAGLVAGLAALTLVVLATVVGGPVAAVVVGAYAVVAAVAWRRRRARQRAEWAYEQLLDHIDGVAGDLRAGLAPDATLAAAGLAAARDDADAAVQAACARLDAAYRISEALGAPLADVIDRVDADVRATRRARATVEAQTAGARATSTLLAGLPVAGLGLGAGMGADPVHLLLHTPVGGACALAAVACQCAGLGWIGRLVRGAVEAVR
jgi:tight adherence protein B